VELRLALLARQLLLEPAPASIPRALEQIGGIQNQYAPNGYLRLRSCLRRFERDDLTRALEQQTVVQGTLMRGTIHLVSAADYWPLAAGIRRARREWSLRLSQGKVTAREMESRAARARSTIAGQVATDREIRSIGLGDPNLWLDLVRVPPSGTWERRRANLYRLADEWLGPNRAAEDAGLELLVRRYLGGFGPATIQDISSWSGVPVATLTPVVGRLKLRRYRSETGDLLYDLARLTIPAASTPVPVRYLPTWDAILLVHARRTAVLPEPFRKLVFHTKNPQSVPTFMVDGQVAGAWKAEPGRITLLPFRPLARGGRRELEEEAERLLPLFAATAA